MMDYTIIYHANCADGFTAAWIANKFFSINGHTPLLIPSEHNKEPDYELLKNTRLYILDFSYPVEILEKLKDICQYIVILDHHEGARRDLEVLQGKYSNLNIRFDINKSGAGLTWDYFFPSKPRVNLVNIVEDRDLWRFNLEYTKEVMTYIFSFEYTIENWNRLDVECDVFLNDLIKSGIALQRKHMKDINEFIGLGVPRLDIQGYNVPVINIPYTHGSEACNILCENEPFAAYFYIYKNDIKFGLRSKPDTVDVSDIAKCYGGNGHVRASGFKIKIEQLKYNTETDCFYIEM